MLDFERRGCDLRYTITIGSRYWRDKLGLRKNLKLMYGMISTFSAIYLHCGQNITSGRDENSGEMPHF